MHLDTCFLVDLQRERRLGKPGAASRFLAAHAETVFAVCSVVAMEYAEGFSEEDRGQAVAFLSLFPLVNVGLGEALAAAAIRRDLRTRGALLADNDILVAGCARHHGVGLVTRDAGHFARIANLVLVPYG